MNDLKLKNFFTSINTKTLGNLLKLIEKKLKLDLNTVKAISDKLNVKNLSILFPGLNKLYPDEPDKEINVNLSLELPRSDSLVMRDFNMFFFSNIIIDLQEKNNDPICQISLVNYINLMIESSILNLSKFYFNEPNLKIKEVKVP